MTTFLEQVAADLYERFGREVSSLRIMFPSRRARLFFADALAKAQEPLRKVVASAALSGIAAPAFSSALAYYDATRTEVLPANMIQAMRDYFGAHTYERIDKPRGEYFHTVWTGTGGSATSTTYNV